MMKKFLLCFFITCSALFASEEIERVDNEKLSEALGHLIVRHLDTPGFNFDLDKLIQGMQDERANKPSPMNEEEYEQAIFAIQETLFLQAAENNLAEANDFLNRNVSKDGVEQLDDKLQYLIIKTGQGKEVDKESIPLIHYKGSLLDGTIFADSHESGEPVSLPIQQTIPGFAKGIVGMKEGEKRTLYIHPELAYGIAENLPPNSLLIFEIEVIKANEK